MRPAKNKMGTPDLFRRRIIITMPPWAPYIIAGGVITSAFIPAVLMMITEIVCVVATFLAVLFTLLVRKELREMRYNVHALLNDIDNDTLPENVTDFPVKVIPPGTIGKVNGDRSSKVRLSGQ
jgi:hypothetical protein